MVPDKMKHLATRQTVNVKRPAIFLCRCKMKTIFLYSAASCSNRQFLLLPCLCGENERLELLPKHFDCCLILDVR